MAEKTTKRIAYIDWLRGFACLVMFQTHCYDSWLGGAARDGGFLKLSQLGGTLPAPLFLFLAGISFALVTDKLRQKGVSADEIARTTILRGGEIFLLGLLFRLQEFLLGQPSAPWTDLLRVDILNVIGVSLMMMGVACRIAAAGGAAGPQQLRRATIVTAVVCAAAIAGLTPPLWTSWRPHFLPWWLESYINGVHTFGKPQPWLFPIFPWAAFAFVGLAAGSLLLSDWARKNEAPALTLAASEWNCFYRAGTVAGCAPRAGLQHIRFLAHQSEFLCGSRRNRNGHSLFGVRMVPVGSRRVGLQSSDRNGEVFAARLLGAHRICLWRAFHRPQAQRGCRDGNARANYNFCRDDSARNRSQPVSQVEAANVGAASGRGSDIVARSCAGTRQPQHQTAMLCHSEVAAATE